MVLTLGVWAGGLRTRPGRARKRGPAVPWQSQPVGKSLSAFIQGQQAQSFDYQAFSDLPPSSSFRLMSLRSPIDISIGASRKTRRYGACWSSRTPRKGRASRNEGRGWTSRKSRGERGDRTSRPPGKCLGNWHLACTAVILTQLLHAASCSRVQRTKSHLWRLAMPLPL